MSDIKYLMTKRLNIKIIINIVEKRKSSHSGLLRIAVNGQVIENEEREFFRGTDSIKPKSVAGKFVGKVSVSEHFEGVRTFLKHWNF